MVHYMSEGHFGVTSSLCRYPRSRIARTRLVVLALMTQTACRGYSAAPNGSPNALAVNAIPVQELCADNCGVVLVDTTVRAIPELRNAKWEGYPVVERLQLRELRVLAGGSAMILADGTRPFPAETGDTARLVVALINDQSGTNNQRIYAILFYTPKHSFALWRVTLKQSGGVWTVANTEKLMQA